MHDGQAYQNSIKQQLDALISSKKRVLGTFDLYNVKTSNNGHRYFDIHILVTSLSDDVETRLAFERLESWHRKYQGQHHYLSQLHQQPSTLYEGTISSKQKHINKFESKLPRRERKNEKEHCHPLERKSKTT